MIQINLSLVACIVSSDHHSFAALQASRECVIAIPAVDLAPTVVKVGNCSGRHIDKFAAFGLTPLPASQVASPLVKECFANLECRTADTTLVARFNLFVLEVVKAWMDPAQKAPRTIHHQGYGKFVVDGRTMQLESRMR